MTLLIFTVCVYLGYVLAGVVETLGHRLWINHIRKQCDLPRQPLLRAVRR